MIRVGTKLSAADNSGAKILQCISVLGFKKSATIGDLISVSVKKASTKGTVKKKSVERAVVVRVKKEKRRSDGSYISFSDNAACIVDSEGKPKGTRIKGPIGQEARDKFAALGSIAAIIY
jgi:large subunit ribosomal protein L14